MSRYRNNVGTTRYHGFELSLRQRLSRGLTYSIAYTRSKLMDDASSVFDASILTGPIANYPVADSFNRTLERDYSTGDIPHLFVSSVVWDCRTAPAARGRYRGCSVPSPTTGRSPRSSRCSRACRSPSRRRPTSTRSPASACSARICVGDPSLPADQRTAAQWFNTAAFAVAPQFTIGSASRNPVRGPSYRNVDMALMRRIPIRSSQAIEVRAEVFNLLNTTNLGTPNAVLGAANFGTITTAFDPRVVQLAVKFLF